MKTLFIIYHSLTGRTKALADAVLLGAQTVINDLKKENGGYQELPQICFCHASDVGCEQMRLADAIVFCTPENFGYMSGEIKSIFDRTYDAVREETAGRSYSLLVSCGNDGRGAVSSIERVMIGYGMTVAREALIVRGEVTLNDLIHAQELGQYMLAGLAMGII